MNSRLRKKLEKKHMADLLDTLRRRQEPSVDGDTLVFLPSSFVKVGADGVASFTDPEAKKVASDASKMRHKFLISTPAEDRAGDVVRPKGCVPYLKSFEKNATVYFNHRSAESFPVGTSLDIETGKLLLDITEKGIDAWVQYHDVTDEAVQTYELVERGFLKGASIGFRPIKAKIMKGAKSRSKAEASEGVVDCTFPGLDFLEWELLEWSVVGTPCNQEAVREVLAAPKFAGKTLSESLRRHFERYLEPANPVVRSGFAPSDKDWLSEILSEHLDEVDAKIKSFESKLSEPKMAEPVVKNEDPKPEEKPVETPKVEDKPEEKKPEDKPAETPAEESKKVVPAKTKYDEYLSYAIGDLAGMDKYGYSDPNMPHGAKVLGNLLRALEILQCACEDHSPRIENAKTSSFLAEQAASLEEVLDEWEKFGKKTYPDYFKTDDKSFEAEQKSAEEAKLAAEQKARVEAEEKANAATLASLDEALKSLRDKWYSMTGEEL